MNCFFFFLHSSADRELSIAAVLAGYNPIPSTPPHPHSRPMSVYPAERGLMRLFRELKIVYLLPVLCCCSASCHRSVLFSQEISRSSPEVDLGCTDICLSRCSPDSACIPCCSPFPHRTFDRYKMCVLSTPGSSQVFVVSLLCFFTPD